MAENLPLRIQRHEVQLLEDALEAHWQRDHRQAMRALDWDFLIAKCLQSPKALDFGWWITCREAVASETADLQEQAVSLRDLFDLHIRLARLTRERAREFAQTSGHVIEGLMELDPVIAELERRRDKYLARLALMDPGVIAEARAEHAAGDYPTPGEALADLLAARHAARFTPSYADLRAWADRSPPPADWFAEEDDPT